MDNLTVTLMIASAICMLCAIIKIRERKFYQNSEKADYQEKLYNYIRKRDLKKEGEIFVIIGILLLWLALKVEIIAEIVKAIIN